MCEQSFGILEVGRFPVSASNRTPIPVDDFLHGIDACAFDLLCICETWRGDNSESWTTTLDHKLLFSGGSTHCGVGTGIGRTFALEVSHVHSHVFSGQICALHAAIFNVKLHFFCVYLLSNFFGTR